jgi:hypothetical protein
MRGRRQRQTFGGFIRSIVVDLGLRLVMIVIVLTVVLPLAMSWAANYHLRVTTPSHSIASPVPSPR